MSTSRMGRLAARLAAAAVAAMIAAGSFGCADIRIDASGVRPIVEQFRRSDTPSQVPPPADQPDEDEGHDDD